MTNATATTASAPVNAAGSNSQANTPTPTNVSEIYGAMVFDERVMKERLPKPTFKELMRTINDGEPLNLDVANIVAHAMKEWAIENGATHFTHWSSHFLVLPAKSTILSSTPSLTATSL